ncbi:MAG: UDP-N-acetylglucosamine 1-carboxyvinyltransferase [Anaerolineaceae bacterium]|nr:UDP-N-acetylglucosamine 1-carboxyvinyltransferase [Anaerolineaceae bacterium]
MSKETFVIHGGVPLRGTVRPGGNKNAAIKMLPACLLVDEPVVLHNIPRIRDVDVVIAMLRELGAEVEWLSDASVRVDAADAIAPDQPVPFAQEIRASFVFAGPLLGRFQRAVLPSPGGDVIGERRMDPHINALRALGAEVQFADGVFSMQTRGLKGAKILLQEASVMATENAILAAVLAEGTTVIDNAAGEPHVQDLCHMLNGLGGKIQGIGANRLLIEGVQRLHGGEATVSADYMEVASWVAAAAITRGEIRIQDAAPQQMIMAQQVFARLGIHWDVAGPDIVLPAAQELRIQPDIGGRIPIIKAQPWPAFPTDLMSVAIVVATQCEGAVLFHDWMYESRLFFTDRLMRMGARITLCDPHRALVQGPAALKAVGMITSPDIRAGMALVLGALAADGVTRIANIQQIDRGYEKVEEKLTALGADIRRVTKHSEAVE